MPFVLVAFVALLGTALAVAANVGTDLLPEWEWVHNGPLVWAIIGGLTLGIAVLSVVQYRIAGSRSDGALDGPMQRVVVRQRVTGLSGGTVVGSTTGPIFAGPVMLGVAASTSVPIARTSNNLPPRDPNFVGREGLLAGVRHNLANGPPAVVALRGMGGVGKSHVALELAYQGLDDGEYEVAWWIRAESLVTMLEDLIRLASTLHIPVGIDQETTVAAVRSALRNRDRWLLIFDNASSAVDLSDWLPNGGGHTLITSRERAWGGSAVQLDVGTFTRAESLAYLRQRTGRDQSGAGELAQALGDLPLALAQATAYLDLHGGLSISGYLRLYQEHEGPGLLLSDGAENSVATTWLIHFEDLAARVPAALELLRLCSYLDPDSINLDVLLSMSGALRGPLTGRLAAAAERPVVREHIVGTLTGTGLITRLDDRRIRVHRLVSQVTRQQLSMANDRAGSMWAKHCVQIVAVIANIPGSDHEEWESADELLPHVLQCVRWMSTFGLSDPTSIGLSLGAGRYLVRNAHYAAAAPALNLALRMAERRYGADRPEAARVLNVLAALHQSRAEYAQAETLYRRALAIRERRRRRRGQLEVAETLNDLGWLFRKQGRYLDALPLFRRALELRERILGPSALAVARTVNDLGCLVEEIGRYLEAEQLYLRALSVRERSLGTNHPDTATTLWDLGWVYRRMGQYRKAEAFYDKALTIRRQVLGDTSLETAMSCCDLAWIHLRTNRQADARKLLVESLTIRRQLVGDDHPDVAMSLQELGVLTEMDGDLEEARRLYGRTLAIRERRLGHDHPDTAAAISGLARVSAAQGNLTEAASLYRRAISIHDKLTDIVHPDLPVILYGLAEVRVALSQEQDARTLLEQALEAARSLGLQSSHPDIAPIRALHDRFRVRRRFAR